MARASTSLGNPKHLSRFIRQKAGKTIQEIALEDHVTEDVVKNSIRNVEFKQGYHTNEYLNQTLIGMFIKLAPTAQVAMLQALAAGTNRESTNDHGEKITIFEPDHDTRLKAVAELRQIAAVAQPKAGHQTNVKVGVGVGVGVNQASGSFVGMEDRMRELRQKMKDQPVLPDVVLQTASLKTIDAVVPEEDEDGEDE
jgi:tetrahydromethanopterin S-methyltransferase subunit H